MKIKFLYVKDTISTYLSHESMMMHRYGYASQNGSYYDSLGSQVSSRLFENIFKKQFYGKIK